MCSQLSGDQKMTKEIMTNFIYIMFSVEFKMYFLVDMCDDLLCAKFGIITRIPREGFYVLLIWNLKLL